MSNSAPCWGSPVPREIGSFLRTSALLWLCRDQLILARGGTLWRFRSDDGQLALAQVLPRVLPDPTVVHGLAVNRRATQLVAYGQRDLCLLHVSASHTLEVSAGGAQSVHEWLLAVAFAESSEGERLVGVTSGARLLEWAAGPGNQPLHCVRRVALPHPPGLLLAATLSSCPEGELLLAAASALGLVALWRVRLGVPVLCYTARGHAGPCWRLAWLPGSRYLLSASDDRTAAVWDLLPQAPALPQLLFGHSARVTDVAPVGADALLSASADGTVRLWTRSVSGWSGGPAVGHSGGPGVWRAAPRPDSQPPQAAVAMDDGAVRLLPIIAPQPQVVTVPRPPGPAVSALNASLLPHCLLAGLSSGALLSWSATLRTWTELAAAPGSVRDIDVHDQLVAVLRGSRLVQIIRLSPATVGPPAESGAMWRVWARGDGCWTAGERGGLVRWQTAPNLGLAIIGRWSGTTHPAPLTALCELPHIRAVCVADQAGSLFLVRIDSLHCVASLAHVHSRNITHLAPCLVVRSDSAVMVDCCSRDGQASLLRVSEMEIRLVERVRGTGRALVAVGRDEAGRRLLLSMAACELQLLGPRGILAHVPLPPAGPLHMALSSASLRLAAAPRDRLVAFALPLSLEHSQELVPPAHQGAIHAARLLPSPTGWTAVSAGEDEQVRLWTASPGTTLQPTPLTWVQQSAVRALTITPDKSLLLAAGSRHSLRLYRLLSSPAPPPQQHPLLQLEHVFDGQPDDVRVMAAVHVALVPTGHVFATACSDGVLRFYTAGTSGLQLTRELQLAAGQIALPLCLAFASLCQTLAVGWSNGRVDMLHVQHSAELEVSLCSSWQAHDLSAHSLDVATDGVSLTVLSGGDDQSLTTVHLALPLLLSQPNPVRVANAHSSCVRAVRLVPSALRLLGLSCGSDQRVQLWAVYPGRLELLAAVVVSLAEPECLDWRFDSHSGRLVLLLCGRGVQMFAFDLPDYGLGQDSRSD